MARNGSGTHSVPNSFTAGTTITAAPHNANWADISAEITNSLALDGQSSMSGQFKSSNGTVAAPGIAFASDLDSGWYRIGANNVGLALGGTKVLDASATGLDITGTLSASGASTLTGAVTFGAGGALGTGTFTGNATLSGDLTLSGAITHSGINTFSSTSYLALPSGTTGQEPAAAAGGRFRWNSTTGTLRVDTGAAWKTLFTDAEAATQAEMEAGSSTAKFVSPGRTQYHPGVAKAWGLITYASGVPSLVAGYGVSASVTDGGVGDLTITLSTAMSNTSYAVTLSPLQATGTVATARVTSRTTTTVRFGIFTVASSPASFDPSDGDGIMFHVFGDQ